ncbi:MAG: hypothetical protein R2941_14535 [Desulfobacterales bacterium]
MKIINDLSHTVVEKYGSDAFQYDLTEGFAPQGSVFLIISRRREYRVLRRGGADHQRLTGRADVLGKVLISKGDRAAVEAPTYLGAILMLNPCEPEYVRMDTDDEGLILLLKGFSEPEA